VAATSRPISKPASASGSRSVTEQNLFDACWTELPRLILEKAYRVEKAYRLAKPLGPRDCSRAIQPPVETSTALRFPAVARLQSGLTPIGGRKSGLFRDAVIAIFAVIAE